MSNEFAHKCLEALLYEVALFCLHLQHLNTPITDPLISTESGDRFARALVLVECRRKPASSMIFISKRPPVAKSEKNPGVLLYLQGLVWHLDSHLTAGEHWDVCLLWSGKANTASQTNDGKILRGREKAAAAATTATTTTTTTTTTATATTTTTPTPPAPPAATTTTHVPPWWNFNALDTPWRCYFPPAPVSRWADAKRQTTTVSLVES